jgi:hypothetical protein
MEGVNAISGFWQLQTALFFDGEMEQATTEADFSTARLTMKP